MGDNQEIQKSPKIHSSFVVIIHFKPGHRHRTSLEESTHIAGRIYMYLFIICYYRRDKVRGPVKFDPGQGTVCHSKIRS